jgi:hypothetical protein
MAWVTAERQLAASSGRAPAGVELKKLGWRRIGMEIRAFLTYRIGCNRGSTNGLIGVRQGRNSNYSAPSRGGPHPLDAGKQATMGARFSSEEVHGVFIQKPDGEQAEVQCDLNKHGADLARAVAAKLELPMGSFALVFAGTQIQDKADGETLFEMGFVYTGSMVHLVKKPASTVGGAGGQR